MVYAKDTNARIEKRREDTKVSAITNSGKKPTKTTDQKDKEVRRFDNANAENKTNTWEKNKDKCYSCGAQSTICKT